MTQKQNLDQLVSYIERWLGESDKRTLSMLSRYSGIAYPTLRRIAQKESEPSSENALHLLNFVATISETLAYFRENTAVKNFYERVTNGKEIINDTDFVDKLLNRESCWVIVLACTLGATEENVRSLLGSYGIAELNKLIEEGILIESRPGCWTTTNHNFNKHIESQKVGVSMARLIAELPPKTDSLHRYMTYNITEEKYEKYKEKALQLFSEFSEDAQGNEGNTLIAGSIVFTRVLSNETDERCGK